MAVWTSCLLGVAEDPKKGIQWVCCHCEEAVPKGIQLPCLLSSLQVWQLPAEPLVLRVWLSFTLIESDSTVESVYEVGLLVSAKISVIRTMGHKSLYFLQSGAKLSLLYMLHVADLESKPALRD